MYTSIYDPTSGQARQVQRELEVDQSHTIREDEERHQPFNTDKTTITVIKWYRK